MLLVPSTIKQSRSTGIGPNFAAAAAVAAPSHTQSQPPGELACAVVAAWQAPEPTASALGPPLAPSLQPPWHLALSAAPALSPAPCPATPCLLPLQDRCPLLTLILRPPPGQPRRLTRWPRLPRPHLHCHLQTRHPPHRPPHPLLHLPHPHQCPQGRRARWPLPPGHCPLGPHSSTQSPRLHPLHHHHCPQQTQQWSCPPPPPQPLEYPKPFHTVLRGSCRCRRRCLLVTA
mmetsp:Transcript_19357/g.33424  ORF Transcript_19357/g.33424 Transcript_19357/m.33424 type:complete len:231 (-) Transcript_19357:610-1302(-)